MKPIVTHHGYAASFVREDGEHSRIVIRDASGFVVAECLSPEFEWEFNVPPNDDLLEIVDTVERRVF